MRALPLVYFIALVPSCVSEKAHFHDVRQTTSARLGPGKYSPERSSDTDRQVRELLRKPLTAESAVQIALWKNPEVQAAFEELGVARAALVHALRLPNPTAEAAMRFDGNESSRPELEVSATLDLAELLFLPLRAGVADAQLEAAKASVVGAVLDLAFDVRVAFYHYQAEAQILEMRRTVLQSARASYEGARALHAAGNIPDLDFNNERALYEDARVEVATAEMEFTAARERLGALLGLWSRDMNWTAAPRLPEIPSKELDVDALERQALDRSLDLAVIKHRFEAAAKRANLARAQGWLPELKAGVSAEREDGWEVGPVAEIEVPLFYQGQGQVGIAQAEMRRQQQMHAAIAIRIRAAVHSAIVRLSTTRETVNHYRTVLLPLRETIVNDTQLQFNAMNTGVFQLLQAKRDQIQTGVAYIEALRNYWIARAESEQLLAGRLMRSALSTEDVVRELTPLERGRGGVEQH